MEIEEKKGKVYGHDSQTYKSKIYSISSSNPTYGIFCSLDQISIIYEQSAYEQMRAICSSKSHGRKYKILSSKLAQMWAISVHAACKTLDATSQYVKRDPVHPLCSRYKTKHIALRYNHLNTVSYTNTMFSTVS